MSATLKDLRGRVHGKTIELEKEPGLPDGQEVNVTVQPMVASSKLLSGEGIRHSAGANASPRRSQSLQELLDDVTVLDVSHEIARKFGELRAGLLDAGQSAPEMDLLIAATALVHDLTLVTHNARNPFTRVCASHGESDAEDTTQLACVDECLRDDSAASRNAAQNVLPRGQAAWRFTARRNRSGRQTLFHAGMPDDAA